MESHQVESMKRYNNKLKATSSDYKSIIRNSLGNKCFSCGSSNKIHIHHNGYIEGMIITDLQLLCVSCHRKSYNSKGGRKKKDADLVLNQLNLIYQTVKELSIKSKLSLATTYKILKESGSAKCVNPGSGLTLWIKQL